jgi:hypothetical protein
MIARRAALVAFVVHLLANPHYGFFRDELYFIICGRHPALGYVDQPPLVPLAAALSQLAGRSLLLLRAIPAACAAGSIYVTCRLAQELGGGVLAETLAAVAAGLSTVLCSFGTKLGTDTPGLVLWPLLVLLVLRLTRRASPRTWLAVGAVTAVAVLAKYSVLYLVAALVAGLACTRERRILRSRWCFAAVGLASLAVLPNALWQAAHGFPMLDVLRAGQHGKNVQLGPAAYVLAQLVITNPILALVWLAGLVWLACNVRWVALAYGILIAAMIASHAKHYYPACVYPVLFAAGGVAIGRCGRCGRPVLAAITLAGLVTLPSVVPVLPLAVFERYHAVVHLELPTEHAPPAALPQDYADMQGWPELARTVEDVYRALPASDRRRAVVVASNYGEAAAIDFFADLPPTLSGHNQYWLWGTHGADGSVVIDVHGDCGAREHLFDSAELVATVRSPLATGWENPVPISVCRGLRRPLATLWPALRLYY